MGTNRMTWMAAVLGTVAVAGMMGCHKDSNSGEKGAASISANVKLAISDVASMTVVVQGGTMAAPITVPLVKKGNQFSALVSDLPVGTNYSFTASAMSGATPPVELYHGAVTNQTIIKNQTANIVINMNQDAAGVATNNSAPVIDSITATSLALSQNDTATITAVAHDPDAGQTALMTWAWATTCGSVSSPVNTTGSDTVHGTSQVVFTAPAADGPCTVNLTVTDANGVLKNVASLTITVNASAGVGSAKITAIPDTYPVISGLNATPVPLNKGVATTLSVIATDADGDALNYSWTSPCTGAFGTATAATTTFTLDSASAATTCDFVVVVNDGTFPDGTPKGGVITNHLTLPVFSPANNVAVGAPVFGYDYQSQDTISGGDVVKMAIVANQGCAAPGVITLAWTSSDSQVLGSITPSSIPLDATLFNASAASYTAPAGAEDGSVVTITVTATCSSSSLSTAHTFTLVPLNSFCFGKTSGTDCTAVANGANKCVTAAACNSSGVCVATASNTCANSGDVCKPNVCDKADGVCKPNWTSPTTDGTFCSDGNACTTGQDLCSAGVCQGTATHVCTPPSNTCQQATCNPLTNACDVSSKADGVACNDQNGCTGTVTTPWTSGNPGVSADSCHSGVCVGGTAPVSCGSLLVCTSASDTTYTCDPKVCVNPSYAKKWVPPFSSMAVSASGTPWATGLIYNPFDFGTGTPVTSTGSADVYLVKINPATGLADAAFTFGDAASSDQGSNAVTVASNGNVGLVGTFNGEIDFNSNGANGNNSGKDFLQATGAYSFYALFDGTSSGTDVTVINSHIVDMGTGALLAAGSNPGQAFYAVCGKASKVVPQSTTSKGLLTSASPWVAGNGMDIVVALFDAATGAIKWGKQIGGVGDQTCQNVTVDNNGDVVLSGNYTGTLDFGGGALPTVPAGSAFIYVAKLKGSDGSVLAAHGYGSTGRSDAVGLTVDASNNIIVAGSIAGNIDFGGGVSITDLGLADAYVAKFTTTATTITPAWAKSFGDANYDQAASSVTTNAGGDVFFGGSFEGTLGALGLTSAGNTATDAFVAQLSGTDGSVMCAHAYGDASGTQTVLSLVAARTAGSLYMGGTMSGEMRFTSAIDLNSGSPGLSHNYIARLVP